MINNQNADSNTSFDVEVKSITKNNRSNKTIEPDNRSKKNIYPNSVFLSNNMMQKVNPIKIKRAEHNRSSSSKLKKKKSTRSNFCMNKNKQPGKQNFNW